MQKIEISARTIIFTVLFILSLRVIWLTRELIYALFMAFIFMSALKPLVNGLEKRHVPRGIAAFVVFMITLVVLSFSIFSLLPPIVVESISFLKTLPILTLETFPFLSRYISADSIITFLPDITVNFVKVASGVFSNFIFLISVIFFTFYFLLEEKFLSNFLNKFLEKKQANMVMSMANIAESRMGAWLWGELVLMMIIGVFTYIGLALLQVPFALPLAFLAGLLEIIPIIGPTVSLIPAFFVAASASSLLGGIVIVLYFIIQQLESNIVVPVVMKKAVGIHPILTLIALTVGGKLGGLLGIILSVPIALFLETIVVELSKIKK